jgi:hypothetical protein
MIVVEVGRMRSLVAAIAVVAIVAGACAADDAAPAQESSSTTTSTASLTAATSTTTTTASVPDSTTTTVATAAVPVPGAPQSPAADSESRGVWPQAPDVWYPAASPYLTIDSAIEFRLYARRDATVQVGAIVAEPVQDWAGGNAMFVATIGLDEGPNTIPVDVDGVITDITVVRGPSWQRRYGRVLDTWGHDLELGIDFGEMDLEPDYGQGDFSPGEIAVVFKPLADDIVLIDSPFWEWETITRGDDAVWEYFAYGEGSHMDVYNILLDGDTVLQLEGPVPLGD